MEEKDMAKNCSNCNTAENQSVTVPYVVHESAMARAERNIKRLWIAIIASIVLLFASNAFWLWAWMQYDYESYEAITDSGGDANIIGNDGDIYNGYGEVKTEN
jgi:uncharacterized paraquat-inducible protein A